MVAVALVLLAAAYFLRGRLDSTLLKTERELARFQELETMSDADLLEVAADGAQPVGDRREALKLLRRHGAPQTGARLAACLADDRSAPLRESLIMSVGYAHEPEGAPALVPYLLAEDRQLRMVSSFAFARIFGEKPGREAVDALERLAPLLGDGNPFTVSRRAAVSAVLRQGGPALDDWVRTLAPTLRPLVSKLLEKSCGASPPGLRALVQASGAGPDLQKLKALAASSSEAERLAAAKELARFEEADPHFGRISGQGSAVLQRLELLVPLCGDSAALVALEAMKGVEALVRQLPYVMRKYEPEKALAFRRSTAPLERRLRELATRFEREGDARLSERARKAAASLGPR
jgi:hypothetical protein